MNYNPQAKFRDYLAAIKNIKQADGVSGTFVIYGSNDFLIQKALGALKKSPMMKSRKYIFHDACELNDLQLFDLFASSPGLFESAQCQIIQRCEKNSKLFEKNNPLPKKPQASVAVLCFNAKTISKKIINQLNNPYFIPCTAPNMRELPSYVKTLARTLNIQLVDDAIQLLIDSLGSDLSKLSNEMKTLALIFPAQKNENRILKVEEIRKFLTYIREDHAFEMEQLLLKKDRGKSMILLSNLLDRGDSPMAILGILAQHCRKAIYIIEGLAQGISQQDLAQGLKIPAFVVRQYVNQLARSSSERYKNGLKLCQKADIVLKSFGDRTGDHLFHIIHHLTA